MTEHRNARLNVLPARGVALLAWALAALLLSACAATQQAKAPVVERAEARWEAVVANQLEAAYEYYSPGFRSANSLIDYGVSMRTRQVRWSSAEYLDHDCEADRCNLRFNVGYKVLNPAPGLSEFDGKQIVNETWVRTNGQWWYLPKK